MSRDWSGKALVDELSEEQSDTSSAHKTRVLRYINDGINDITSRHDWGFLRYKGKKVLTASQEEQDLKTAAPGAATVSVAAGGSLAENTTYNVYITYVDSNGFETVAGAKSADVTPTGANLTISVSAIPTSSEPLVTKRRVYLQKSGGNILFSSEIPDNTTTTETITAEPTDSDATREAPDFDMLRKFEGAPFFEAGPEVLLRYRSLDQMRLLRRGDFTDGTPELYTVLRGSTILIEPRPSSALTLSYYYYRNPARVSYVATSQPEIPVIFKPLLRAYVQMRGYEFRNRDGEVSKANQYEQLLMEYISKYGQEKHARETVRDVYGDSDGFEITDT